MRFANENRKRVRGAKESVQKAGCVIAQDERVFRGWSPTFVGRGDAASQAKKVEADRTLAWIELLISLSAEALRPVDGTPVDRFAARAGERGKRKGESGVLRPKHERQNCDRYWSSFDVESGLHSRGGAASRPDC